MGNIKKLFDNYLSRDVSPYSICILRVFLGISILAEYILLIVHHNAVSVEEYCNIFLLMAGALSTILFTIGYKTTISAVVHWLFLVPNFSFFGVWEYHLDYGHMVFSFLYLFVRSGEVFSVDSYLNKSTERRSNKQFEVFILLLIGVAFIYLDSIFYKFSSPMWLGGLGLWFPATMPFYGTGVFGWMLEYKWIVLSAGFITLLFELSFVVLMLFRRIWILTFIVGFSLHFGIAVFFPIVNFGVFFAIAFMLIIPSKHYEKYFGRKFTYISNESIFFQKKYLFISLFFFAQMFPTSFSPYVRDIFPSTIQDLKLFRYAKAGVHKFMGITRHPVFTDGHFRKFNFLWKIVDSKSGKPAYFFGDHGYPLHTLTARVFVRMLRVSVNGYSEEVIQEQLIPLIKRLLVEYGDERSYDLYIKKYDVPKIKFELGVREKIEKIDWTLYQTISAN